MLVGMGKFPRPMRRMAFLPPTTDSVHPPVCWPSDRGAVRPDMAPGLLTLTSVQILARNISDHAPILKSWGAPTQTQSLMWCFSACYLKDPECVDFIDQELRNDFREDSGSEVTLWGGRQTLLKGGYQRICQMARSPASSVDNWVREQDSGLGVSGSAGRHGRAREAAGTAMRRSLAGVPCRG
ncbi:hypothetical protein NDU88_006571 [Pleurodeles waltl]|uniref:Uncharacterized protein n=1 Tax=Pleurodeles waltl TaxID=8319 RepID=A0AAV7MEE9_PLEWA|nr:hypothetical protein NDU88_006571 [Pleurodeles waltl]